MPKPETPTCVPDSVLTAFSAVVAELPDKSFNDYRVKSNLNIVADYLYHRSGKEHQK